MAATFVPTPRGFREELARLDLLIRQAEVELHTWTSLEDEVDREFRSGLYAIRRRKPTPTAEELAIMELELDLKMDTPMRRVHAAGARLVELQAMRAELVGRD